ncbi:MAG: hypothetical protein ACYCWE_20775 [Eubacteriales bacterium]
MKSLFSKIAMLRFLKKIILFSIAWIVLYSITMIIIFCIKDTYPELLTTVTFAYFSIEIVVSAGIKIYESFRRKTKYDLPAQETDNSWPEERESDYNEHT